MVTAAAAVAMVAFVGLDKVILNALLFSKAVSFEIGTDIDCVR